MAKSNQSLLPKLTITRQKREHVQMRVAKRKAYPSEQQSTTSANPSMYRRFQKLIEYSQDHITLTTAQGQLIYTNNVAHILGYSREEYMALGHVAILHPADRPKVLLFWQALCASPNTTKTIEVRNRHQQGHYVWVEVTSTNLLHDPDIAAIVSNSRDISARKAAAEALSRNEDLFRGTFEQAAVGMAHVSPNGRWLRVNKRLCAIVGYSAEELAEKTFQEISYPADLDTDLQATHQLLKGEIQTYSLHKRYIHKHGHLIWVNLTVSLVRKAKGLPDYFVAVVEDITQLKLAEQALRQSEERYRHVVEAQTDLICRFDANLNLTFINQPHSLLFDKSPEEMIGINILDGIPPEYHDSVMTHLASLNATKQVSTNENPLLMADGTQRWFQWTNRIIVDEAGRTIEYQNVGRDITERRQAEEAEREQRRFAEAMRDSLAALTSSLDVDSVMQQILKSAAVVVPSEAGSIVLFEGDRGRVAYLRGFPPEAEAFFNDYEFSLQSMAHGAVLTNKQAYYVPHTKEAKDWISLPITDWIRSSIGMPIELRGKVIGLLIVDSATPHHFQPQDIERLQAFANYASLALENAYQVTHLEERVSERTAQLQAAKEQVEAILNNSVDGILLVHSDLRIKQTNEAFNKLFACPSEEWVNLSLLDFIYADDVPLVNRILQSGPDKLAGQQIELRAQRRNGEIFDAELSIGQIKAEGLVCTLRDITERKRAQNALAEERNLLRTLIDAMPNSIYVKDTQHRFILHNAASKLVLGNLQPDEFVGKTDFDLLPAPLAEKFFAAEQELFRTGQPVVDHEEQLVAPDGSPAWISITKVPLRNLKGEITGLAGISYDITERKQTAEVLREQRDFLQLVINSVPDLIMIKDRAGHFQMVNDRAAQIYGITPIEMLGKTDADVNHNPSEVAFFLQKDQETLDYGQAIFIPEEAILDCYYQTTKIPLKNPAGRYDRLLIVASDITERKRIAEALREQRDFLQLVINSVPDLITVNDRTGYFHMVNERAAQIYGLTPADMVGKTDADVNHNPSEVAFFLQTDQAALDSEQVVFIAEQTIQGRYYQTTKIPLRNSAGQPDRLLVVSSDITERKQAEAVLQQAFQKEKELSELKSRFVSMASHEFRTPLTSILLLTETLLFYGHKLTNEQIAQRLANIREQVGHLKDITEDVLQLAHTQTRRIEISPVWLDLDALCRSIIDEFQERPDVTQRLIYRCDGDLQAVKLDKKLMRQIVSNLISNASKYSLENREILVHLAYKDEMVVLEVHDEGIGIPEADLIHLFQPFQRGVNVGDISGTGLGLAITKEAVELHGGTISVESQLDVGTTFTVKIPVANGKQEKS